MNFSNKLKHPVFKVISELSTNQDIPCYVIGGFVRDLIIGRPSKDIDIVVVGNGMELAQLVANKLRVKKVSCFKNYGTAHFKYKDIDVEFVGARKESYSKESRNPTVKQSSLKDDQKRRDFTINALALDLNKENYGNLIDPFDGIKDLENGVIRTPFLPLQTYSDDPLRMLRAIRFASQLNFSIEIESLKAIHENAYRIEIISQERISEELNKILLSNKPSKGLRLLKTTNLLKYFFPELIALNGVETINGKSHKDNFNHTLEVIDNISENTDNLWLRWAALLHDIAKPKTKKFDKKIGWTFHGHEEIGAKMVPFIFKRMRLPLDYKMKFVKKLVRLHLRPIALVKGSVTDSALRRLLNEAGDDIDDLMLLCNADITSKNDFRVKQYKKNFKNVIQKLKDVEQRDKIRNFQPPISGELIMKSFDIAPCKEVGIIKASLKEAILDGKIQNTYQDAYDEMVKLGVKLGLHIK